MPRYRIRIVNITDRTEQLRLASRVREYLIANARVWLDSENPLQGIHRDTDGHTYFEFAADDRDAVGRVLNEYYSDFAELTETEEALATPCQDCGNIAGPVQPPVCPNCGFQDIAKCPVCGIRSSRQLYDNHAGNLFFCPTREQNGTRHLVRLAFNEPMFKPDGRFNQPLLLVKAAIRTTGVGRR